MVQNNKLTKIKLTIIKQHLILYQKALKNKMKKHLKIIQQKIIKKAQKIYKK